MTANLKDLKAMLGLCENLGAHVRLWFDSPGNPLVAEPHFPHTHGQVRRGGLPVARARAGPGVPCRLPAPSHLAACASHPLPAQANATSAGGGL